MSTPLSHRSSRSSLAARLPRFPWDALEDAKARAAAHEDGIVDLSVGTPVDPTPASVQRALAEAANAPGYPTTIGTHALREAIVDFCGRHRGARVGSDGGALTADGVIPLVGSKELVAHLPFHLGVGANGAVAHPHIAYPTYDMGARFVGAAAVPLDMRRLAAEGDAAFASEQEAARVQLLWLNSPSNPTGAVMSAEEMAAVVRWARERGVIVASDECYALLPWEVERVPSVLDVDVNDGRLDGVLCVYSLSKQSNLAGYRAAFAAGDPALVGELIAIRKQAGQMMPAPIQAAMTAALGDDAAADAQRAVYGARRERLVEALRTVGGEIEDSVAGLYLWVRFPWARTGMEAVERLAEHGILCAPGMIYGEAGQGYVRIALTASDERIDVAAERLARL